ncbi:PREDICTED: leukocyte immunoglobulin-like receptor subfamily B member 3 [Ceratotherium simum simum]|uniref:Leukocyte immunoglobulin-like receptor subfamily B member 3 n=1 Tax=Ceratotherium simum simum TaxID=73337 RepID=A0ABM1DCZ1_CERSS|nr:PREDICTED: leukocyte immunoglobulin-like receptor subfamily B member 3 [Ceratotherium simum simum]
MTTTFMALFYLGLSVNLRTPVHAGTLPKPTVWAEPGSVVTWWMQVTIWCQGALEAKEYCLDKEGSASPWSRQSQWEPGNKVNFSIPQMTDLYAGQYRCYYHSLTEQSDPSDPLKLVVTGVYSKPSLSALPSPVVTSGGNVTLQCGSWLGFDRFILAKEGEHQPSWTLDSQRHPSGQPQALFPVGPVTPSLRWTFRCYGYNRKYPEVWSVPSDPLELLVSGVHSAPSLSSHPGPVVASGENVFLSCSSETTLDTFHLLKEGGADPPRRMKSTTYHGRGQAVFPVGPVNTSHGGIYRCYVSPSFNSYVWSHPSDPLYLKVTGMYEKPSLSAHPGPSVSSGENVTLQCRSEIWLDNFHLSKEGSSAPPEHLHLQNRAAPFQANFTISPVTSDHEGTYKCYGSNSTAPYLLSLPSDPLNLLISGLKWYLKDLIGVSVAFVLVLSLLLFLLIRCRCQGKHRTSAPAQLLRPRKRPSQDPHDEDPQRMTYAQAAVSEDPQDMTYAQLNHLTLRWKTTPPSSQSEDPPAEPSVYAALAIH